MRVSVIGCGHLGIPHAAAMAELGHEVIGVDVDQAKVDRLNAGQCPIYETRLPELLAAHTASGRLRFTTDIREAADFADLHFIGTGTPINADGRSYDTAQVYGAVRQLAPLLTRPCTIVGKSTVTVGTTAQVTALAQRLAPAGQDVDVVWNPEFLREGHAVQDTLRPDRLIAGITTAEGEKAIRAVYAPILDAGAPIFVTDPRRAPRWVWSNTRPPDPPGVNTSPLTAQAGGSRSRRPSGYPLSACEVANPPGAPGTPGAPNAPAVPSRFGLVGLRERV
ncbi:nucleotide sugar dehydrogenase [Streptomyces sp. NPDC031705]|uniref:nucleotide sugar dehydrogenase n=1 Tax=Streptomyces sp. NPDC031705 TaxID=3155729 RepID=UPI0033D53C70